MAVVLVSIGELALIPEMVVLTEFGRGFNELGADEQGPCQGPDPPKLILEKNSFLSKSVIARFGDKGIKDRNTGEVGCNCTGAVSM